MNERLKELRKTLGMTQQEFADRIALKRNTIASYEIGRNVPMESIIRSICREFRVSEAWLRDGEGPMFVETSDEERIRAWVDEILTQESESYKVKLVSALVDLDDKAWEAVYTLGKALARVYTEEETEDERIEREAEMVKRNYIESQKGRTGSGSSGGGVDTG